MTSQQVLQLFAALIATVTPLVVVSVVFAVAARHARDGAPRLTWPPIARRLVWLTAGAGAAVVAVALMLSARVLVTSAAGLSMFALLALPALRALAVIDAASRPFRDVQATTRQATLTTRRSGHYIGWQWRAVAYVITIGGLAAFAWRATSPAPGRQWAVPATFALATAAFLWLYEVWIHTVITGPGIGAEADEIRRRTARRLLVIELVLVMVCIAAAHAVIDLNWTTHEVAGGAVAMAGGVVGLLGCALAVASGVSVRRYAPPTSS